MSGMIETVGEGLAKPDALAPIRIESREILEWLVTRKKISSSWRSKLPSLQLSIKKAIPLIPQNSPAFQLITDMQKQPHIGYFDCLQVFNSLLTTESHETTLILGSYTSPSLRAWNDICKNWSSNSRENIHIADAADELVSILQYDIPAERAASDKSRQAAVECNNRIEDNLKTSQRNKDEFNRLCHDWDISPPMVIGAAKPQLGALAQNLYSVFSSLVSLASNVDSPLFQAVDFYKKFARITCSASTSILPALSVLPNAQSASSVKEALEVTGKISKTDPDIIMKQSLEFKEQTRVAKELTEQQQQKLLQQQVEEPVEITDFGIELVDSGMKEEQKQNEITDFGIELVDSGIETVQSGQQQQEEKEEEEEKGIVVAFMWDIVWRRNFVNDLWELREFLQQRKSELIAISKDEMMSGSMIIPNGLPEHSINDIEMFILSVNKAIELLEGKKTLELLEIRESRHFVERIAAMFDKKIQCSKESEENCRVEEAQRKEFLKDAELHENSINELNHRVSFLVANLTKGFTSLFPGREIIIS